ncbi:MULTISPECIES: transposase [unclassified Sinorhizobium]|uniref:transposase n=1 Tax=unclassified Sinorhizobium TaxID=2613772 RepID=UPI003523F1D8
MVDESDTGSIAAEAETDTQEKKPPVKKQTSRRRQKTAAESVGTASRSTAAKPQVRKYSGQEKAEKLKLIEAQVVEGTGTLKDAIKSAGISEQTYYNWKNVVKPVDQSDKTPAPAGDELADLVQLEEENKRLRKLLAEKLRKENAELRRRLGMD